MRCTLPALFVSLALGACQFQTAPVCDPGVDGGWCPLTSPTSCLPNHGNTVYVNQAYGSDTLGTGVSVPPTCAFHTLTRALAVAADAGNLYVEASGGDSIFGIDETFPMEIPAGVVLTTDTTATYQILMNDVAAENAPAAVEMGPGSTLEGFTVQTGFPNADGIDCDAGAPSITNCVVLGPDTDAGPGVGIHVTSGQAFLNGVTVQGFGGSGLFLDGPEASASVDGGTFAANGFGGGCNGDGILMKGSALQLDNVTVAGNYRHGLDAREGTVSGANVIALGDAGTGAGLQGAGITLGAIDSSNCGAPSSAQVTLTGVTIQGNDNSGVEVNGGTLALLAPVAISGNGNGVQVESGETYLENPIVDGNGSSGLRNDGFTRNDAANDGGSLVVDGGIIGPDDMGGKLTGKSYPEIAFHAGASLTLEGTTVQQSPDGDGVYLSGSGSYALTGCDITGNAGNGLVLAGGNLTTFTGNRLHANGKYQILVAGNPGGKNTEWALSGQPGCDGGQNEIYCYADGGNVGLEISTFAAIADSNAWEDARPLQGTDYSGSSAFVGTYCPAVTTCP
ncbi:MAG: right-handed parallel beta-helix repeat-containing protein [Myxococcales bacterium]